MATFVATVAAVVVAMVLLIAFGEHARFPGTLPKVLRAHGVLPNMLVRPAAVAVTATEVGAGGLTAYGVVTGQHTVLRLGLIAAALVLVGYGTYSQAVWRRTRASGQAVPCGCSHLDTPLTGWIVTRAYLLTGLAAAGAVTAGHVLVPGASATHFGIALAAGTAFAAVLWLLPQAMRMPPDHQQPTRGRSRRLIAESAHD